MSASNPPSGATATSPGSPVGTIACARSEPVFGPDRRLRLDLPGSGTPLVRLGTVLAWIALAGGFVLIGAGNLDLGPVESRLGLAAHEGLGPFGQVYGGWEPALWPGRVVPSQLWARGEGGTPSAAAIRWPDAIAGLVIGLLLTTRLVVVQGRRAGLLAALCLFGSVGLIHRSELFWILGGTPYRAGLDLMAGLAVVGALDRILGKGSDTAAGLWAALAVLAGGWPALALILLPIVVLGRPGQALSARLVLPPLAAFTAWSAWALGVAPAEAWGAALALPLTQPPAWPLTLDVLAFSLPWGPFAVLAAWPGTRAGWTDRGRALILGWLRVLGVALLAGTLIPGLAAPARMAALAGLAVATAGVLDRVAERGLGQDARRVFLGLTAAVVLLWAVVIIPVGGLMVATAPYYRPAAILLVALGFATAAVGVAAARAGKPSWALGTLLVVAVSLKLAHWGLFVPESNYRYSKGPWGRAIGQWVVPDRPIYTFHTWPTDLMFHTGQPIRQLPAPESLKFRVKPGVPEYVLLLPQEYDHWPVRAPKLIKVHEFEHESGFGSRILARTEGDLFQLRPVGQGFEDD